MTDLSSCRSEVDKIDVEIAKLLEQRFDLTALIAVVKRGLGTGVVDHEREFEVRMRAVTAIDERHADRVDHIFREIIKVSNTQQFAIRYQPTDD